MIAFLTIVELGFRQHLVGLKKFGYLTLALLPALFAGLWALLAGEGGDVFFLEWIVTGFHFKFVLPLLGVLVGVDAVNAERANRTVIYLFTRPVSKSVLYLGKVVSAMAFAGIVSTLTLLAAFAVLAAKGGGEFAAAAAPTLGWAAVFSGLAVAVYVALFAAIGAVVPFPLVLSLFFGFVWEGVISSFRFALAEGTVVNCARGLLYQAIETRPVFRAPDWPLAILLAVGFVSMAIGMVVFREASYTS